jgi:hypothetical protein
MTDSLQALGQHISLPGDKQEQILEVATRLDHDMRKARVLFQYHCDAFERDPSGQHWSELIALMAGYQYIHNNQ